MLHLVDDGSPEAFGIGDDIFGEELDHRVRFVVDADDAGGRLHSARSFDARILEEDDHVGVIPEVDAEQAFEDAVTILDVLRRGLEGRLETDVLLELARVADDAVAVDLPGRIDPTQIGAGVGGVLAVRIFLEEGFVAGLGFRELVKPVMNLGDKEFPVFDPLGIGIELQVRPSPASWHSASFRDW